MSPGEAITWPDSTACAFVPALPELQAVRTELRDRVVYCTSWAVKEPMPGWLR